MNSVKVKILIVSLFFKSSKEIQNSSIDEISNYKHLTAFSWQGNLFANREKDY